MSSKEIPSLLAGLEAPAVQPSNVAEFSKLLESNKKELSQLDYSKLLRAVKDFSPSDSKYAEIYEKSFIKIQMDDMEAAIRNYSNQKYISKLQKPVKEAAAAGDKKAETALAKVAAATQETTEAKDKVADAITTKTGEALSKYARVIEHINKAKGREGLEMNFSEMKSTLIEHTKELKARLASNPDDADARKEVAELKKTVEKLLLLKNGWSKKLKVRTDSEKEVSKGEDSEMESLYTETQTALADLEDSIIRRKLDVKDGWDTLHTKEKIAYFADLDQSGGSQEYNTTKGVGFFGLKKISAQKFITGEKQIERAISSATKGSDTALTELVTRIAGEAPTKENYSAVREKFGKNLLNQVETLAILTEGMGKDFRAGLGAVLLGKEAEFISAIENHPKFKENLKAGIDGMRKSGISEDQIMDTLTSMGIALAAQSLGLIATWSKNKTGTDEPLSKTLVSDESGEKNIKLKATLLLPTVELQLNWNDRDEAAKKIREAREAIMDSFSNEAKDGFDTEKVMHLLGEAKVDGQPLFDEKMKEEFIAKTKEFETITKSFSPDQKKRYFMAMKAQWASAGIQEYIDKNSGWGIKGLGVGVFLIMPFIKLNLQKISKEVTTGKTNDGTDLEREIFTEKSKDIKELGLSRITEEVDEKVYIVSEDAEYSSLVLDTAAKDAGVIVDEKSRKIIAPKEAILSFTKVLDTQTGGYSLHVDVSEGKPTETKVPVAPVNADPKYLENSLDASGMLLKKNVRMALSSLAGEPATRGLAEKFSETYASVDRRDVEQIKILRKEVAKLLLASTIAPTEMKILAKKLAAETDSQKISIIIDTVRFGMMTDRKDVTNLFSQPPKNLDAKNAKPSGLLTSKSPISGKTFSDALASTGVSGITPSDFAGVLPNSGEMIGRNEGEIGSSKKIAMVGSWKLAPASMTYMPVGTVGVATSASGKKFEKEMPPEKKSSAYDMFASSAMFKNHELAAISTKVEKMTAIDGKGGIVLTPTELKTLVIGETVKTTNGGTLKMNNAFTFFAYGACTNPSVGIDLGLITYVGPDKVTVSGAIDTAGTSTVNPVGSIEGITTNLGIGKLVGQPKEKGNKEDKKPEPEGKDVKSNPGDTGVKEGPVGVPGQTDIGVNGTTNTPTLDTGIKDVPTNNPFDIG